MEIAKACPDSSNLVISAPKIVLVLSAAVLFAGFLDDAGVDEALQFFVGAEAKHLLATGGGVARAQVFIHDREKVLEFKGGLSAEDSRQLFRYPIWTPT